MLPRPVSYISRMSASGVMIIAWERIAADAEIAQQLAERQYELCNPGSNISPERVDLEVELRAAVTKIGRLFRRDRSQQVSLKVATLARMRRQSVRGLELEASLDPHRAAFPDRLRDSSTPTDDRKRRLPSGYQRGDTR